MKLTKSIFLLLAVGLAACQSIDGGDDLEKGIPYQLTAKETGAIQAALQQRMPAAGVLLFGPILASKDSKGGINVCGTFSAMGGYAGVIDKRPYVGMMVEVPPLFEFMPVVIADDSSSGSSAVIITCHRLGIPI
ncbi:MAG: hypothetical protein KGI75_26240 [Rhizobiaceae bacterium]|nr:hypothetical protein [Rhizobiaceae bacterium]